MRYIMKINTKIIVNWESTGLMFWDSDKKMNSLGKHIFSDGTVSKETAKFSCETRTAGSQNPTDYKVVRMLGKGYLNPNVYTNSRKKSGGVCFRSGIHGQVGMLAGVYVYWTIGKEIFRQTYDLAGARGRDVVAEKVGWWDKANRLHCSVISEQVEVRKVRNDSGKAHNTQGLVLKASEQLSMAKREAERK